MKQQFGGAGVSSAGSRVSQAAAVLLLPLTLATQVTAQCDEPLYSWQGAGIFGRDVSGAGDVNGDGYDDVVVSAPQDNSAAGTVYVYSGFDGSILHSWNGEHRDDRLGDSVDGAGDVDGDGFDDVIAGANDADVNGVNSGAAYVVSGDNGELLHVWYGEAADDRFGWAVSGAGDVNRDAFDDVIVSARYSGRNGLHSGSVSVYSGLTGEVLYTWTGDVEGAQFGYSVSGAGDVNGDGFDDIIVGTWDNSASVYDGATGDLLYTWYDVGREVSGAGDVNGDGFADLIVGHTYTHLDVHIFSGATGEPIYVLHGNKDEYFGEAVSGAGDFDGDGFDDVIVGAPVYGSQIGSAYLYSGATGDLMHAWYGEKHLDFFGDAVSGAGDMDGDGLDEIIIGAYGSETGAYVYSLNCSAITLLEPSPGLANRINRFEIYGATPNDTVMLAWGFRSSETGVPGCPGVVIMIGDPRAVIAATDDEGYATIEVYVPPVAQGMEILFQAVDPDACLVSDLVQHVFE